MSAAQDQSGASETELRATLIERCRLSAAAIDRITTEMHESGHGFAESALSLAFATQQDIDESRSWLSTQSDEARVGIVQEALRKLATQRQVIVRPGETTKPGPRLAPVCDPYNARGEAIRSLRTELLLRNSGRSNVVCVVSPSAQEGRSQLAAELAIAFAQLGRRTLLVDADMRKPSQHVLFPTANDRGLGDALSRGDRAYQFRVDGLPQMSLALAGRTPSNPLELLSGGRFERMLTEWRNANEFVVIDTPPVTAYADALAVATLTGRAMVVTRSEKTTFKDMREMMRRLATTRTQILGAAVNHF